MVTRCIRCVVKKTSSCSGVKTKRVCCKEQHTIFSGSEDEDVLQCVAVCCSVLQCVGQFHVATYPFGRKRTLYFYFSAKEPCIGAKEPYVSMFPQRSSVF